ncbi:MAG: cytochrome P450 [Acidimicrobiia bacterium]|nr:cytochrome P450 [Acidimicrobiia bacterium]
MGDGDGSLPNPLLGEFWIRPAEAINADIDTLRAAGGVTFHPEPEIPEGYLLPQGPGAWALSNFADILHVSKNPKIFSSARGIVLQDLPPEFVEFFNSMIGMDDPRHARLRRLVSPGFTPRMLAKLDDSVQEVASAIVDRIIDADEIDFVTEVASALPLKIVCDLMGIPDSSFDFVLEQTNIILGAGDPEYVAETDDIITSILLAGQNLADLMNEVADAKRGGDGTDLTSVLLNAELEDDQLSPADLASFFILLVVAGNETTRNAISWALTFLTDNPDQRQLWQSDFENLAPQAVEEIVRLASPVTYMRRTVTRDTVIGDTEIAEDQKVAMFYLLANRDPNVFDNPHGFDIMREQKPHVGFGGPGPHYCLGAHLARREITVMFRELFNRVPDIRASGPPDLLFSSFIHGVKHLPAAVHG